MFWNLILFQSDQICITFLLRCRSHATRSQNPRQSLLQIQKATGKLVEISIRYHKNLDWQSEHDLRNAWQQCRLWNVSNKCKFIRELKSCFSDIMWYLCGRLQWDYRLEVEAPSSDSSPDSEGVTPVRHLLSYSFASANKMRSFISLVHFPEDTTV